MRIAQVAPLAESVPPKLYGGTERVVGSYLAFLGRLTPDKGPETAIEIARAADMPLHIAAKVPRGERRYFKEQLEPLIDSEKIRLSGEVDERTKQDFLAHAAALVFPIDWPEPFDLVMGAL